jgi:hypothetical protein
MFGLFKKKDIVASTQPSQATAVPTGEVNQPVPINAQVPAQPDQANVAQPVDPVQPISYTVPPSPSFEPTTDAAAATILSGATSNVPVAPTAEAVQASTELVTEPAVSTDASANVVPSQPTAVVEELASQEPENTVQGL